MAVEESRWKKKRRSRAQSMCAVEGTKLRMTTHAYSNGDENEAPNITEHAALEEIVVISAVCLF